MRFDKREREEISKIQLEYVHPHCTYCFSYYALKWERKKRGDSDKTVTLQTEKMKVGLSCCGWILALVSDPSLIPSAITNGPTGTLKWYLMKRYQRIKTQGQNHHTRENFQHTLRCNHKQKHRLGELVTGQPEGQCLNKIC